jgi:hypothetical protein
LQTKATLKTAMMDMIAAFCKISAVRPKRHQQQQEEEQQQNEQRVASGIYGRQRT